MSTHDTGWYIFKGTGEPSTETKFPGAPPWRQFTDDAKQERGQRFVIADYGEQKRSEAIEMVNAAIHLRRPLLITGKPGIGKSTLAHAVAYELNLGTVLFWPITTRSTLQDGIYHYDAIARLQDASLHHKGDTPDGDTSQKAAPDIGQYIRLGPLGTALAMSEQHKPRVLLIDEIDKSDIDLPNDLLHVFEEGEFEIKEISRLPQEQQYKKVSVWTEDGEQYTIQREQARLWRGLVRCTEFPLVLLTSNGEREFPPAFLRRCLRLELQPPADEAKLAQIVAARLQVQPDELELVQDVIAHFFSRRDREELATDQLLNAVYVTLKGVDLLDRDRETLLNALFRSLSNSTNR
jgi:MoxR-like ATPase